MDGTIETLVRIANTEFSGASLMGSAFLPCIKSMSLEEVKRTDTFEGYSVLGITLHVLYHKYATIRLIQGSQGIPSYKYEEADWPKPPKSLGQASWDSLVSELGTMHEAWIKALKAFPMSRYEELVPAWNCTVGQVLECIACHDMYHVAQIRNMGLQSTR